MNMLLTAMNRLGDEIRQLREEVNRLSIRLKDLQAELGRERWR